MSTPGAALQPEQIAFADFEHQYLREYIAFADQKAGFAFAIFAAMTAFIIDKDGLIIRISTALNCYNLVMHYGSLICLIAGAGLSALIVFPHLRSPGGSLIYFGDVASRPDAASYLSAVVDSKDDLTKHKLEHCYKLAEVCRRKYKKLQWAFATGAVGLVLWVLGQ